VKEAAASNAAGRASASTTVKEAGASNAAGRASASTTAEEADTSHAAGRASASTAAQPHKKGVHGRRRTSVLAMDSEQL
jgi:hypothetical protein